MDFPGGIQGQQEASGDKHVGCDIKIPFLKMQKWKMSFALVSAVPVKWNNYKNVALRFDCSWVLKINAHIVSTHCAKIILLIHTKHTQGLLILQQNFRLSIFTTTLINIIWRQGVFKLNY